MKSAKSASRRGRCAPRKTLRKDWDTVLEKHIERAANFGPNAKVLSEMSARCAVLDALKAHGIQ